MVNITSFLTASTTASNNEQVNGIGIDGTNPVSNFDNAQREMWAILRRDLDGRMVLTSKSAGYTAVANDNNTLIRFSAAATLSLPAAATLGAGWHCWVMADGAAVVIDPNSSETINGATTITIPDGATVLVICDGTNFRATEDYTRFVQATVDVASAATTNIGAAASWNVRITGTTTITAFDTADEGTLRFVRMAGALTLTHNATSLILPGAANITTAANDCFLARSLGSGNWIVMFYQQASKRAFRAYKSADQTGVVPSTFTKVTFNTEAFDVGGLYDTTNNRWTPVAGTVMINASVYYTVNVGDQEDYRCAIYKNGSVISQTVERTSGSNFITVSAALIDVANGTDYYEIYAYATGGLNKTIGSELTATWFAGVCL